MYLRTYKISYTSSVKVYIYIYIYVHIFKHTDEVEPQQGERAVRVQPGSPKTEATGALDYGVRMRQRHLTACITMMATQVNKGHLGDRKIKMTRKGRRGEFG